jgi:hypothetical protein
MTNQQALTRKRPKLFTPVKDNPAEAEKTVRRIFKLRPCNLDLAATALTPLYGFGEDSDKDPYARNKVQALFASVEFEEPIYTFSGRYIRGEWSLPVARWKPTMALVQKYKDTEAWTSTRSPVPDDGGSADQHYARFLIYLLQELKSPPASYQTKMLGWLRDAVHEEEEDVCWVLFHALMYRQLRIMHLYKTKGRLNGRASHYVNRLTCLQFRRKSVGWDDELIV